MKKYLLFVSTDFGGGVSRIIRELGKNLQKYFNLKIFVTDYGNKPKHYEELYKNLPISRFRSISIARAYSISFSFLRALIKEKPDIIHGHHYGYFPLTCAFIAAKINKIPFVASTYLHPPSKSLFLKALFYLYHYTQGKWILKGANAIIVSTKMEKEIIESYGINGKKIFVIPNPIDTKRFAPLDKHRSKNKKIVLFVGPLNHNKGADIFFDIAKKLAGQRSDVAFVLIGRGELDAKFRDEAKQYGNKIKIINYVEDDELIKMYSLADLFVLPTHYESFGMGLVEAMACGTPVISARVGAVPEIVPEDSGFLFDYGKWSGMEKKINYLLDNPDALKKIGAKARDFVLKNFDISKVAEKLRQVYDSL